MKETDNGVQAPRELSTEERLLGDLQFLEHFLSVADTPEPSDFSPYLLPGKTIDARSLDRYMLSAKAMLKVVLSCPGLASVMANHLDGFRNFNRKD